MNRKGIIGAICRYNWSDALMLSFEAFFPIAKIFWFFFLIFFKPKTSYRTKQDRSLSNTYWNATNLILGQAKENSAPNMVKIQIKKLTKSLYPIWILWQYNWKLCWKDLKMYRESSPTKFSCKITWLGLSYDFFFFNLKRRTFNHGIYLDISHIKPLLICTRQGFFKWYLRSEQEYWGTHKLV